MNGTKEPGSTGEAELHYNKQVGQRTLKFVLLHDIELMLTASQL